MTLTDVYATKVKRKGGYYYFVKSQLGQTLNKYVVIRTLNDAFEYCKRNNLFLRSLK